MSWDGYFTIDGQEFINVARTEAYAGDQPWFRPLYQNDALPPMLADSYTTPAADAAPWFDPAIPESADFFGLYPLDVSGIEDSSRSSAVTEYTTEGGTAGKVRHATKSVVFNAVLLAASEKAVQYGMVWLRRVLLGDRCNNPTLDHGYGTDLTFAASEPLLDDDPTTGPTETFQGLLRSLRRFTFNAGPSVTAKRVIESCGGAVWVVTFTGVAGTPWQFGVEKPILQGYLDPAVTDPWVPGVTGGLASAVTGFHEVECGTDIWEPIYDPNCPPLIVPPAPPAVPLGCFELPEAEEGILATNLDTNPSVETNATTWAVAAAHGTGARTASVTAEVGGYVYRSTVGATIPTNQSAWALQKNAATANHIPATPGQTVGWYIRGRCQPGQTRDVQLRLRAYAGATAGAATGFGTTNITLTENWQEFLVTGVLPAGNDGFALLASPTTVAQWTPGSWTEWDASYPWVVTNPGFDSYFDGDTPDDDDYEYAWTSTPNGSTSTMTGLIDEWDRRTVTIPASVVPIWESMAPVLTLYAPQEVRNARLRLYQDPEGTLDPSTAPCAFTDDLVVSYIPAEGTLIFDAAAEEVWVETVTGQRRRADTLVFTTNGTPFTWPDLTCGFQHLMTLDTPAGTTPPVIDLSLVPKVA